jgi:hypothetical protein
MTAPRTGHEIAGDIFDAVATLEALEGRIQVLCLDGKLTEHEATQLQRVLSAQGRKLTGLAEEVDPLREPEGWT